MAKTSFKGKRAPEQQPNVSEAGVSEASPQVDWTEAAVVCGEDAVDASVARPVAFAAVNQVLGDIDESDIKFPRLEMVYGVGALSETFDAGDVVYNGSLKLASKGEPVFLTVASLTKFYQEALPFDPSSDVRPRIFMTKAEVEAAGLWTEWRANAKPPINECAMLLVLVECPANVDPSSFPLVFQEKGKKERAFGIAQWWVRNTSYTRVAKPVISARAFQLRESLLRAYWELRTTRQKCGDFVTTLPLFRCMGANSPELQEFLRVSLGGAEVSTD